jgi:hypothetical protein
MNYISTKNLLVCFDVIILLGAFESYLKELLPLVQEEHTLQLHHLRGEKGLFLV